ncbi:diacylglycerol kinase family protein [Acetobacter sp. DsW_063]|uniref:diacylglycerol/lipid kinase family protein n=1 Tax=Acetobacter sp. DsW_063 TaxID=1514894 RepID=UPI000A37CF37|nr:acylglycerol kinase family protein [Acetobacter sp. DsW_063]OUJ14508.1 diacylglycerol kinase [Acetobacter sp. DsW_063]
MTSRLALIHNPRSRRNARDGDGEFEREAARQLGPMFLTPSDRDELFTEIKALAAQGVRCIVVNGGDGTVSDVMSAIIAVYPPGELPALAILPSGNTNLIAEDVGLKNRGVAALTTLLERERNGTLFANTQTRHPIVVSWPGSNRAPIAGMFCGLAAFTRGIELAHQPAILNRYSHDMAVLATVIWAVRQLLRKETRRRWMNGEVMSLAIDEGAPEDAARFLFLCSALHRLGHGVWPFWNSATPANGGFFYLDILANPKKLPRALASLMRSQKPGWLRSSSTYRSGQAGSVRIETRDRLVLDGEELDTGPDGCILLAQGPGIAFVNA